MDQATKADSLSSAPPGGSVGRSNSAVLGDITWLLMHSPMHRRWPVAFIERFILPAVHHKQFRLFHKDGVPIGYVSWAWLSKEVEDRYLAGGYSLTLADWRSGDRPWFIDYMVPFGHLKIVRQHLRRERLFKGRPIKAIRRIKNGSGQRVMEFGNFEARKASGWRTRIINSEIPNGDVHREIPPGRPPGSSSE